MADTVDTITVFSGSRIRSYRFTNASDGTGESAVAKIDLSAVKAPNGVTLSTRMAILEVQWQIQGFSSVKLFFDATTDDEALILSGNGYRDFYDVGGLVDPKSSGATNKLLFTTVGASSTATYDIAITIRIKD